MKLMLVPFWYHRNVQYNVTRINGINTIRGTYLKAYGILLRKALPEKLWLSSRQVDRQASRVGKALWKEQSRD